MTLVPLSAARKAPWGGTPPPPSSQPELAYRLPMRASLGLFSNEAAFGLANVPEALNNPPGICQSTLTARGALLIYPSVGFVPAHPFTHSLRRLLNV
jgi:hypothetical protein